MTDKMSEISGKEVELTQTPAATTVESPDAIDIDTLLSRVSTHPQMPEDLYATVL